MDPVEAGILRGARRLGIAVEAAQTGTRYALEGVPDDELGRVAEEALANLAIEEIQVGSDRFPARRAPGRHADRRPAAESGSARRPRRLELPTIEQLRVAVGRSARGASGGGGGRGGGPRGTRR